MLTVPQGPNGGPAPQMRCPQGPNWSLAYFFHILEVEIQPLSKPVSSGQRLANSEDANQHSSDAGLASFAKNTMGSHGTAFTFKTKMRGLRLEDLDLGLEIYE